MKIFSFSGNWPYDIIKICPPFSGKKLLYLCLILDYYRWINWISTYKWLVILHYWQFTVYSGCFLLEEVNFHRPFEEHMSEFLHKHIFDNDHSPTIIQKWIEKSKTINKRIFYKTCLDKDVFFWALTIFLNISLHVTPNSVVRLSLVLVFLTWWEWWY